MFKYLALGDSITAGENASSPARAYPWLVVSALRHMRNGGVTGGVLAQLGWTSGALTANVMEDSPLPLQMADAITIWVGGNDLAMAGLAVLHGAPQTSIETALTRYVKHMGVLVTAIRSVSRARIILCSQYNPFPNSPVALQGVGALNELTAATAARLNTEYAPVHTWFEGRQASLISGYRTGRVEDALSNPLLPIHPNDQGHRVIAEGLTGYVAGER